MRKQRLYGGVLAMLLGMGIFTHSPISRHNITHRNRSQRGTTIPGTTRTIELRSSVARTPATRRPAGISATKGAPLRFFDLRASRSAYQLAFDQPSRRDGRGRRSDPALGLLQLGASSLVSEPIPVASVPVVTPATPPAPPPAPPSPPPPPPPPPPAQTSSSSSAGVWAELRHCESGGNYSDDTGNGYYGAYQFSLPTWESLGFSGLPSQAPAAVQDQAAQELQARSGWGQWPVCSRVIGVR